ncbi:DUF4292 domain-containing protein [Aridibaculum aurantiacum]|uniref:DUF4292 domain-containing protein n=1 Tax=Aridibaculum aurantiacum TaxID=2810307 RepID=UPI001A96E6AE|nr:DUF4292 domain-containing protein [Aridibaculum aurantiacum]
MRIVFIICCLFSLLVACRPAKKVQRIQTAISKVDTTQTVIVKDVAVDSLQEAKAVFKKVLTNNIDFTTFNAKVRVEYDGKEGGDEATAFIRVRKDSIMWLSLRGALGIEGFRVLITQDSVKVMNLLKKTVQLRSISYLQEMTQLPFDFQTLQDLVVGNPVFIDSNIVSYKVDANNQLNVLMKGRFFKHLLTLDNKNLKVLHSKLDDIDVTRNRTCDITFSNYETSAGVPFSTKRRITVAEQSKLDINLDFKQYTFNQPTTFPFSIPRNYKRQ